MNALKASVIVMGVLIVVGLAVVAVTIANRISSGSAKRAGTVAVTAPGATAQPKAFGTVALNLPPGTRIKDTRVAGRRLILSLTLPGGGERVYVIHLDSGAVLGKIRVGAGTGRRAAE